MSKFGIALKKQFLKIKNVAFSSIYDREMQWETKNQTKNYIKLFDIAIDSKEVIFDDLYAYER